MYNMVVAAFRDQNGDERADLSHFRDLRHQRINDGTWSFIANVPYNVLDEALKEAIQARELVIQRNVEARAAGQDARHRLSFRCRKEQRQMIAIREQNCREHLQFYPRLLHSSIITTNDPLHPRHKDPDDYPPLHHEHRKRKHNWPNREGRVERDSKLTWDRRLKQWTFIWVYEKERVASCENQAGPNICSLDPGVRTFHTW